MNEITFRFGPIRLPVVCPTDVPDFKSCLPSSIPVDRFWESPDESHNSHCELLGPSFQFSFHSLLIFVFRVVFVSAFPLSAFRLYKFSGRFPKPPSPHSTPRVERAHSERFRFPAFRFPLFLDLLRTPSFRGATIRPHREIRRLWHPESPSPASFGNDTVSPRRNCRRGLRCAASCGGHRFRTRTDFSIPCSLRAATPSGLWRFAN